LFWLVGLVGLEPVYHKHIVAILKPMIDQLQMPDFRDRKKAAQVVFLYRLYAMLAMAGDNGQQFITEHFTRQLRENEDSDTWLYYFGSYCRALWFSQRIILNEGMVRLVDKTILHLKEVTRQHEMAYGAKL